MRRPQAHPRLRGADLKAVALVPFPAGSSPLTRGGRRTSQNSLGLDGLIPAYAGRTGRTLRHPCATWAHPRLRGADAARPGCLYRAAGSSPLTRGGPLTHQTTAPAVGLIPAYAGRTILWMKGGCNYGAHPRLRGADDFSGCHIRLPRGSSPLTRGDFLLLKSILNWTGSSPLTRGGQNPAGYFIGSIGLIPAYAGRTTAAAVIQSASAAHPRLRGADNALQRASHHASGSSPLTRGGRSRCCARYPRRGLIPAYAGRTKLPQLF